MTGELEVIWKGLVVAYSNCCPGNSLEGMGNVMRNLSQD
jgi:hypothetical protein